MRKSKQLFVNLAASIVVFLVQFLINFWLSPFIVGKLGEEAHGFITLANNFTQYAMLIAVSINSMSSRFISLAYNSGDHKKANQYYSSVFWMNVVLSVVVFTVSMVIIYNIEKLINVTPELVFDVKLTFALSFLNLIISFLSTCFAATTFVTNRMDLHAYTQVLTNLVKLFVILGTFLLLAPRIYFVSLATVLCNLVAGVIYILLKKKLLPSFSLSRKFFSLAKIWELMKSGVWLLLSDVSGMLLNGMDLLVANLFISQTAMGRLSISKQLPTAVGGLLGFLSNIFTASFTEILAHGDKERLVSEVKFSIKVLGVLLTVPFAGIIVFGPQFFALWLPKNVYDSAAINQVYVLMLLTLINVIVNAYMYSIHSLLITYDKVRVYSLAVFGCSIVSITATLLLTLNTELGVYAVAGTSTVVLGVVNLIFVPLYAERVLQVEPFSIVKVILKNHLALGLTCALFGVLRGLVTISGWLIFIAVCAISAAAGYIFDMLVLLNNEERKRMFEKIMRKRRK